MPQIAQMDFQKCKIFQLLRGHIAHVRITALCNIPQMLGTFLHQGLSLQSCVYRRKSVRMQTGYFDIRHVIKVTALILEF